MPEASGLKSQTSKAFVGFWTTEGHAAHLKEAAKEEGRSLSSYLRFRLQERHVELESRKQQDCHRAEAAS